VVDRIVPVGRLVELCGGAGVAQTSAAVAVLAELQRRGEQVAWVASRGAGLFPPDWDRAGIDLDALLVVHVPVDDPRAGPRATEMLLRTGVMGAVVLDLSASRGREIEGRSSERTHARREVLRGEAWMGRLLGLAREHGTRLVLLSPHDREHASLGPLVSVRLAMRRALDAEGRPVRDAEGRLALEADVLKDKSGLVGASVGEPASESERGARDEPGEAEVALESEGPSWRRAG
jgi:recombination protein RecA